MSDVLKVGIASFAEMKARTLAIARGELKPAPGDPKIWFTPEGSVGKMLSTPRHPLSELPGSDEKGDS